MFGMYPIVEAEPFYSFPYQDYHTNKHTPFKKHTPINDLLFEMFEDDIFNSIFEIEPRLKTPKNKKDQQNRGLYCNPSSPSNNDDIKKVKNVNSHKTNRNIESKPQQEEKENKQSINTFSFSSSSCSSQSQEGLKDIKNDGLKNDDKDSKKNIQDRKLNKLKQERRQRKNLLKQQQQNIQRKQRESSLLDVCYPLLEVSESLEQVSEKDLQQDRDRKIRKNSRNLESSLSSLTAMMDSDFNDDQNTNQQQKFNDEKLNENFYIQTQSIRSYENTKGERIVEQRVEQNKNGDLSAFVSKKVYDKERKLISNQKWREDPDKSQIDSQNLKNEKLQNHSQSKTDPNIYFHDDNEKNFDPRIINENSLQKQYSGDNIIFLQNLSNPKAELVEDDSQNYKHQKENIIKESETQTHYQI